MSEFILSVWPQPIRGILIVNQKENVMKGTLSKLSCIPVVFALLLTGSQGTMAGEKSGGGSKECCKEECTDMCSSCHKMCLKTLSYCIKKGGKHVAATHVQTMLDCIDMCDLSSRLSARNSELTAKVRQICNEICTKCANSCEKLNDPQMKECVDMCRKCAKHCSG